MKIGERSDRRQLKDPQGPFLLGGNMQITAELLTDREMAAWILLVGIIMITTVLGIWNIWNS